MNKIKIGLYFLIFLTAINLSAQGSRFNNYFISSFGTGPSIPTSNFSNVYKLGLNFGLNGGYLFTKNIEARLSLIYVYFPYKGTNSDITGGTLHDITVKGDLLYGIFANPKFNPYGILGLGEHFFYNSDLIVNGVSQSIESESGFGVSIGVGLSYLLTPQFSIYGETQYNKVYTAGNSTNFYTVGAGVSYKWWSDRK
jgi:outer membrane autotransporter protein